MNDEPQYSRLDYAFSRFLSQRASLNTSQTKDFLHLCAKLSFQQSEGHSCININKTEQALVHASGLLSENDVAPLVIEQNRLYLHRYWFYEQRLAQQLKLMTAKPPINKGFDSIISRYFIELIDETDWQREAAIKCLTQSFSIISGGPGTGKTTTVVKILAIIQELATSKLHIALAAPTGKAAIRLQESINSGKQILPCADSIKQKIPETVSTLHHLLGSQPMSPYFKHDGNHPLSYDLVVVDEASMIDLALMSKLVDALKPDASLILLGDKDQLVSVESGSVLADLTTALAEKTVELKKSYRFQGEIKALAEAVNKQQIDEAWSILQLGQQVCLLEDNLVDYAVEKYCLYLQQINNNAGIETIFAAFNQFQVLCSNRYGEDGVAGINQKIEDKLSQENRVKITAGQWYVGRPVMITQNNTTMQLYNGDIGICLYDKQSKKMSVSFQLANGSIKKFLPSMIPPHETVFAMTVHKSQGSEFEECLCVLPDQINSVLSKELIYTAITRAKTKLKIRSNYSIFSQAISQKVVRTSGLAEKLSNLF